MFSLPNSKGFFREIVLKVKHNQGVFNKNKYENYEFGRSSVLFDENTLFSIF